MKTYKTHDLINPNFEFFKILKKLPALSVDGPWIAGGSIWKSMENIPLECDIDFFFKDENQLNETKRLMNSMPYIHRIIKEKQNRFNTTYDFHIHDGDYDKTVKIQFISFKQWPNPKELLDNFDFTACQFLFDGNEIHTGDDSIEHVKAKKIVLNRVKKPELTLYHLQRYLDKGFTISDDQKKLLEDLKGVANKEIIRNQEIGNLEVAENVNVDVDWTNYDGPNIEAGPQILDNDDNYFWTTPPINIPMNLENEHVITGTVPTTNRFNDVYANTPINPNFYGRYIGNPAPEVYTPTIYTNETAPDVNIITED